MTDLRNEGLVSLSQREHHNDASAKKVVMRFQDPSSGEWLNYVPNLTPGVDYDYLAVNNTSDTSDTVTFKLGGSGGTAVRTLSITYTDASVVKVSDELVSVAFA